MASADGTSFTRIKNDPREYMRNYSIEGGKAPRSQTLPKHTPWIVFANEAGTTYLSPSGKNEMQSVKYMDAFLVIKRKGDWLRLIRYDPTILKNGKLKEWKQAKYCGWDQPKRPVADPERLYRHCYRIQKQTGGHAERQRGIGHPKNVFCQRPP